MSTLKKVDSHNRKLAAQFKAYFRLMPRVIAIYSADAALAGVMRPATSNFSVDERPTGKLMPHNSSNAAWNWRVTFGGEEAPLYDKGKKGSPVGDAFEFRSTDLLKEAKTVVIERRISDINKKLFRKLFSNTSKVFPKFTIYNNIDKLNFGKTYVDRSNVKAAADELHSYAYSGAHLGYAMVKEFMRAGPKSSPGNKALLKAIQAKQAAHFAPKE